MATEYQHIVALTGAGISAESGVATFRDPDGVWAEFDYRDVATPEGFAENPERVHAFYNARRRGLRDVQPNAAHRALVDLETGLAARGGSLTLITQNVDDLHERAGSGAGPGKLIHMHGALLKARCALCGDTRTWTEDLSTMTKCDACRRSNVMRPDIVWFGEMPMHLDLIEQALARADMFLSIGTSGSVYPAAGYVYEAHALGTPCVELNLEPSQNASAFSDARYGKASVITPAFVAEILGRS